MEILIPKTIDVRITGMDNRHYICKLTTIGQNTRISIDPITHYETSTLDLNDKEYLKFYLTSKVNEFIDRYRDRNMGYKIKRLKRLLETTLITNHFDYLSFSQKALSIIESMEAQTNGK